MKKKLILHPSAFILALAALALPAALFAAPVVSNVAFVQQPDGAGNTRVRVTYDLVSPNGPCDVELLYSATGAAPFLAATTTTGAVGTGVTPGTGKTIDWAAATDLPGQAVTGSFLVRVLAEDGVAIPLAITSGIANGGLTNDNASRTLTFIFGEPVTDFDVSDVAVTNATEGGFSGSGATYTLDITSVADGAVSASVAGGAAAAASGTGNLSAPGAFDFTVDTLAPTVTTRNPAASALVLPFTSVTVTLAESVSGLTAGQFVVGGSPATTVTGTNPYTFSGFADPGLGTTAVSLASGGAVDAAGNALVADSWNYTVIDSLLPLAITSNASAPVHQLATQTLTFTFGDLVTGFDASDVTVTNATKGTFAGSGAVYTLEVTSAGGTVTAAVAADAAAVSAPYTNSAAGSFSNFYQDTWTITLPGAVPMELIRIPAGTFTMGSPVGELSRNNTAGVEDQHQVTLSQDFYLGKTEVTQNQWVALQSFPQAQDFVGGTMPVHRVSHDDIGSWMAALNTHVTEPGTFALPTESQWEYAARAGTTTRFNFGDGFASNETTDTAGGRGDNMWFGGNNSPNGTKTVGQKPANAWGLRDMHGNVWEWCADWYATYPGTVTDPTGPGSGSFRMIRGGGWSNNAQDCRSARRFGGSPTNRVGDTGFRVLAVRPVSLAITSTLAAGSSSQTRNQTLTFTFGQPVTGFNASDVFVPNGTKGTFTAVSATVYTLAVTAVANGAVTASVAANAAVESSSFHVGTEGKSFSNTWDTVGPTVLTRNPVASAAILSLASVTLTLTEPAAGLVAGQLTVGGSPATMVTGTNPYTFSGFAAPGLGATTVSLASGSAVDAAGNALVANSWGYTVVDPLVPLAITSNASAPVHQLATQTLTFTFGQPVTGFVTSDVTVTNGTKGTFAGSGSVYTLLVTGTGGPVTVSVAADAAAPPAPYTNTTAATFSNFYQDTWTLDLPGSVPMELIRIPAGTFVMGSPVGELSRVNTAGVEDQHQVTLSQDFYLGKTEVTQAQWTAIAAFTGSQTQSFVGSTMPVHVVTWNEIQTWLTALDTAITEQGTFALPTESQWEYACRAGTTTRFNFGDGLASNETSDTAGGRGDNMWFTGNNSPSGTKAVGQKPANAWGLRDMHGNVWEWCADWYGTYPGTVTDPTGPGSGSSRVLRGGSWSSSAQTCRSARRDGIGPTFRATNNGFRVLAVRPLPLAITSSETAPVHQTATQTLTFTFDRPVTGFDASDISLKGATAGTFTAVSATEYTLEVTGGIGGTVSASVAADAAVEATSTYVGTASASFSNFYQDTWTITLPGAVPMELIRIPAGTFAMGSPVDELSRNTTPGLEDQHQVTLSQDFYLGKTEVTEAQWTAIPAFASQSYVGSTKPVRSVSWNDIQTWLTALDTAITEPGTFALPTESQWEYACRAGTTTRFNFGDSVVEAGDPEDCAAGGGREGNMWYCGNRYPSGAKAVGQKLANAWGLRDMHGNVWEWCADWYGPYPGTVTDPTGPGGGSFRVFRGGAWHNVARNCRSATRQSGEPAASGSDLGFRVRAVRPIPLTITSTLAEGSVSQTATQTLTFTFGQSVTGFVTSDVTVTNGTKGTFAGSGSVYTLLVTGTGGTVTASVAADAAAWPAPYTNTAAATFSNFYQDTWTITLPGAVPMELIRIPAGTFVMGSPSGELSRLNDETQHTVTLSQDFYLGKTEVTQAQWTAIQAFTVPQAQSFVGSAMPVHNVSWNEIQTWLTALDTAIMEPGTFALPTESQWEYAARAGTTTRFNFGDGLSTNESCATGGGRETNMWYCGNNSPNGTKLVGQKPANAWGLRDMHGNVWEWCSDWYGTYPGTVTDPTGPGSGSSRVFRGGSWNGSALLCRSAQRNLNVPSYRFLDIGFRVLAVR